MAQSKSIDIKDAQTLPQLNTESSSADNLLKLIHQLHISIDFDTILQQFAQGLENIIACDSIDYYNEEADVDIHLGNREQHTLSYELTLDSQHLGTIIFSRKEHFIEKEIQQLENILWLLPHSLRNALAHYKALQSALHDPLTNLGNRHALGPALQHDIELAKRHHIPFAILALDLDKFKSINDNYGHGGGDELLKIFATTLEDCVRHSDRVFRTGGEEFVALLSKTNIEGAIKLANRIHKTTQSLSCAYQGYVIHTTTSIGVAAYAPGDTQSSLLEKADQALYRAKRQGRDRVCV